MKMDKRIIVGMLIGMTVLTAMATIFNSDPEQGYVNVVKHCGAVGDGVTDDTPAFEDARNRLIAVGGGKIIVPNGTFILDNFELDNTAAGIIIEGVGGVDSMITGSRLMAPADANSADYIIKISNVTAFAIRFRDLVLTSQGGSRLVYDIGTSSKWQNCYFMGGGNEAYYQDSSSDSGDAGGLYGCRFYSGGATINISGKYNIDGCYFNGNELYHAIVADWFQSLSITNCQMETNLRPVIDVNNGSPTNRMLNIQNNFITCGYGSGQNVIYVRQCEDIRIQGNRFHTAQSGTPDADIYLHPDCSSDIVIKGNSNAYGIEVGLNTAATDTTYDISSADATGITYNGLTLQWLKMSYDGVRMFSGSAAPDTGTWRVGDTMVNADPAPGEAYAQICTKAGKSGTWSAVGMIQSANAYKTNNVITDRALDAKGDTVEEVADVLGTLIEDLKAAGILKSPY